MKTNTRETIRDEAVKYFVDAGLVVRNPDDPARPTNSGKTVYQVEPSALRLCQSFGSRDWPKLLAAYLTSREQTRHELHRQRSIAQIPVTLPSGESIALSPGGQNPLIKQVIEQFCPRFTPGAVLLYVGDAENKFLHLDAKSLSQLGVTVAAAAKMPDVVVFDSRRNWLVLIEAVTSAGPVDGKRFLASFPNILPLPVSNNSARSSRIVSQQLEQRVGLMVARMRTTDPRWSLNNEFFRRGVERSQADTPSSHGELEFVVKSKLSGRHHDQYALGK